MGYTTNFKGHLNFTSELTASQISFIQKFMGEDIRDHREWWINGQDPDLTYIDLELTDEFDGLQWDGSEKTYDLVEKVNFIREHMRMRWPNFDLQGTLLAQGEEVDDRWRLVCSGSGPAVREDVALSGREVECPHCGENFRLEVE